jgi:4-deoxy-L-threo-5-hexosulose-uronate ketol-isomerase
VDVAINYADYYYLEALKDNRNYKNKISMATIYEERFAYHPDDFKTYDTARIRKEFLVEKVNGKGNVRLVYSAIERFIVGGAVPVDKPLKLETIDPLKAEYFCYRREIGCN